MSESNSMLDHPKRIMGLEFIMSPAHVEQFRKPKSKKTRIRKKWRKNKANWRPSKSILRIGNKLVMHPNFEQVVRAALLGIQRESICFKEPITF